MIDAEDVRKTLDMLDDALKMTGDADVLEILMRISILPPKKRTILLKGLKPSGEFGS